MNGALEVSFTPARLNIKAQKQALSVVVVVDVVNDDDHGFRIYTCLSVCTCCLEHAATIGELTRG